MSNKNYYNKNYYNDRHICRFLLDKGKVYKYVPTEQGLKKRYVHEADSNDLTIFGGYSDIIAEYYHTHNGITLSKRYCANVNIQEGEPNG